MCVEDGEMEDEVVKLGGARSWRAPYTMLVIWLHLHTEFQVREGCV